MITIKYLLVKKSDVLRLHYRKNFNYYTIITIMIYNDMYIYNDI